MSWPQMPNKKTHIHTFIGTFIRIARACFNISLRELGNKVGFSASYLKNLENGDRGIAPTLTLHKIAVAIELIIKKKSNTTHRLSYSLTYLQTMERQFEVNKSLILQTISEIFIANKLNLGPEGLSLLTQINIFAGNEPILPSILHDEKKYEHVIFKIFEKLHHKDLRVYYNLQSHFVSGISANFETGDIFIHFKDSWLAQEYEKRQTLFSVKNMTHNLINSSTNTIRNHTNKKNSDKITSIEQVLKGMTNLERKILFKMK